MQDNYTIRYHATTKDAFVELKNIVNIAELYDGKPIQFNHFSSYYLSGTLFTVKYFTDPQSLSHIPIAAIKQKEDIETWPQ